MSLRITIFNCALLFFFYFYFEILRNPSSAQCLFACFYYFRTNPVPNTVFRQRTAWQWGIKQLLNLDLIF